MGASERTALASPADAVAAESASADRIGLTGQRPAVSVDSRGACAFLSLLVVGVVAGLVVASGAGLHARKEKTELLAQQVEPPPPPMNSDAAYILSNAPSKSQGALTAHAMSLPTSNGALPYSICGEAAPLEQHVGGSSLLVQLLGCSVGTDTTEIILSVRRAADAHKIIWSRFIWQPPVAMELAVRVGRGLACDPPRTLLHVMHARCHVSLGDVSALHISVRARQPNASRFEREMASWTVPLVARAPMGPSVVCTGTAIWGRLDAQLNLLAKARAAWAASSVAESLVFARDAPSCTELQRVSGVLCEVKRHWTAQLKAATANWKAVDVALVMRYYDQPINMQLCLAYARASRVQYLIYADTDDFAPPSEDLRLVQKRVRDASLAGVKLFFDADRACPPFFCPRNATDWAQRCPHGVNDNEWNHWKPFVVPRHTADVSAHDFTPLEHFKRKQAWGRACLQHHNSARQHAGLAKHRPRLLLTRPKWLTRPNSSARPTATRCTEGDEWCKLVRGR